MNDRINKGDLITVNQQGQVIKAINETDPIIGVATDTFSVYEDIGMAVYYPAGVVTLKFEERICSFCKVSEHQHKDGANRTIMNHPFFTNNLEYLEWKAHEQS
jgi:hypothetical protein